MVIVWQLDLQLPIQLVPITTQAASSNPAYGEVYLIQLYGSQKSEQRCIGVIGASILFQARKVSGVVLV